MLNKIKRFFNATDDVAITPPGTTCFEVTFVTYDGALTFEFDYVSCGGTPLTATLVGATTVNVCAQSVTLPGGMSTNAKWDIFFGGECGAKII